MIKQWKQLALAAFCMLAASGLAEAADAQNIYRAVSKSYDWSGFYLGANGGWGWRSSFSSPAADYYSSLGISNLNSAPPASKHDGPTFGVGFGYNRQIGWFVWGVEYDFQYADLADKPNMQPRYFITPAGTTTISGPYGGTLATGTGSLGYTVLNYDSTDGDSNKWYGLILGKAGAAFDRLLVYGTVGAAYRFSYDYTDPYVALSNGNVIYYSGYNKSHNWGWAAGGGVEYAITDYLNIKAEYVHMDFGDSIYIDPIASAATNSIILYSAKRTDDLVRIGLDLVINIPAISDLFGGGYNRPATRGYSRY